GRQLVGHAGDVLQPAPHRLRRRAHDRASGCQAHGGREGGCEERRSTRVHAGRTPTVLAGTDQNGSPTRKLRAATLDLSPPWLARSNKSPPSDGGPRQALLPAVLRTWLSGTIEGVP